MTDNSQTQSPARRGKYLRRERQKAPARRFRLTEALIPLSFLLIEVFAFLFLNDFSALTPQSWWTLAFGLLWAVMLTALVRLLPGIAGQIGYGIAYFLFTVYAVIQTGYYFLFGEMIWLSDLRYASEGSDYLDVLLTYPIGWWLCVVALIAQGVVLIWKYPRSKFQPRPAAVSGALALVSVCGCLLLPQAVFLHDNSIQYAGSDYGRAQSAEAAYDNMFNAHRLYEVCGVYQTGVKDLYTNFIYPLSPGYAQAQAQALEEIDGYLAQRGDHQDNDMTGMFEGKNVILVLMESMDDWAIGEHTPTISKLMAEGINFTNFYSPGYGSVRTFNSEFCVNTGSFLASSGGYAFDYVTNCFDQSLASQLGGLGYSSIVYHYNDPAFYSRGVFSPAMGYDRYLSYEEYVTEENQRDLYDDLFLFNHPDVNASFFREGPKLNFIITRSAHLSYKYNEVLSYWGLQKYPHYRGLTGSEEEDCMYLKARLVDDMFTRLLQELEAHGELENTVIVAVTDHYTYGFKDTALMMERSGVDSTLLLEKTPFFIWSADCPAMEVTKTLNTADLLPTVLNLLGIDSGYRYLGQDAFDENYAGYALFPDGSWVSQGVAVEANGTVTVLREDAPPLTEQWKAEMAATVLDFVRINNLILETDYYASK